MIVAVVRLWNYEWDEAKRLANLRKQGIDFTDVPAVFDGDIVTVEDEPVMESNVLSHSVCCKGE